MEINYCCSVPQSCLTLCNPMDCRTPGFPVLHYLPEFAQTHVCLESMMPPNHLILCHPFSSCPQSFPAPGSFLMTVLHIRWPRYWSFSFSLTPSNEYPGLISFRIDWFKLLAVQFSSVQSFSHVQLFVTPRLSW